MKKVTKGTIFIIEGLWGVGKTTLGKKIAKERHGVFVHEPHHLRAGRSGLGQKAITEWYLREHLKNIRKATAIALRGRDAVIERSPVSSIAFSRAYQKGRMPLGPAIREFKKTSVILGKKIKIIYLEPRMPTGVFLQMKRKKEIRKLFVPGRIADFRHHLLAGLSVLKKKKIITLMRH